LALCPALPDRAGAENQDVVKKWYAYVDGRIALNTSYDPEPVYFTDPELDDYKPVPSPDGSQVAFFRAIDYGDGQDITWKTKVCVMNADGTNLRELTGGDYMDTNPMWTRDGSNRIIWTRMEGKTTAVKWLVGTAVPLGMRIYWTSPDAKPGDEERVSEAGIKHYMEFVYSGLKDGRLLVRRDMVNQYYLMTPAPYNNGEAKYEQISYPYEKTLLHKMTISPDEKKIGYMKVSNAGPITNGTGAAYSKSVLAIADFDPVNLVIENEVEITEYNVKNNNWYISFSPNADKLIYACAGDCPEGPSKGQMFQYDIETRVTTKISANDELEYRYPAIKGVVK
jgi:Tol biopolymer transport system component